MHLSIIIPTLNEAASLRRTLDSIPHDPTIEVVLADGGSTDGTTARAGDRPRLVGSAPGRWRQMNAGAAAARGDVLLFLHADSRLPAGAQAAIGNALACHRTVGGAFRFKVDEPQAALRVVTWAVNTRARGLGMPYGDQAIFVRRHVFLRLAGFAALPIMEDVDFVRRLRKQGRVVILPTAVTTSARRWQINGVVRTTTMNWVAMLLYLVGVRTARIRRLYDRVLARG